MKDDESTYGKDLETQVVIVGGGGAGMAAAIAATEVGAEVIVLERRRSFGGNSALAGGIFAAESHLQRQRRIDTRRDICFKEAMRFSHNRINPGVFRVFLDKSADTIRWLENMGLKFYDVPPYYPGQTMITWHCPKTGGRAIVKTLATYCKSLGIKMIPQARVIKFLRDDNGNITGVLARWKKEPLRVKARSIIFASGGFAGNIPMLKKYSQSYHKNINRIGLPHMGEGVFMAMEAGAAMEGLGTLHLTGPSFPPSRILSGLSLEPNTIWVNKKGVRFSDEGTGIKSFEAVNAQVRQPDMISFTLFDSGIKQYLVDNGLTKGLGSVYKASKVKAATWLKALEEQDRKGEAKISRSWDEIADWAGIDAGVLKATIEEYNTHCDKGYDPVFGKDRVYLKPLRIPLFYAMRSRPGMLTTMGGIRINEHMEVVDKNDDPIPGLFAGGNDTGGWEPDTYNINLSGSTFGIAINSGRIAGESAADYALAAAKR
jgi:fumarate reductase flavoprotein subunit